MTARDALREARILANCGYDGPVNECWGVDPGDYYFELSDAPEHGAGRTIRHLACASLKLYGRSVRAVTAAEEELDR